MKHISIEELKRTPGEGLILQGCGGDLTEWENGVNELLTKEGILLDGDTFKDISAFEIDGHTNLLFGMEDVKLDVGRLAMWRLASHDTFGGTWFSDFRTNTLGINEETPGPGPERTRPESPLIGADGNVFNLIGIAARTLRRSGMPDEAKEMSAKVMQCGSYDEALAVIMEYVEPVEAEEPRQSGMSMNMGGM
jgi:hypothetical protein